MLGRAGMGVAIGAGALLVLGVWGSIVSELYWRLTVSGIVVAVGMAHAFLVLLPDLAPRHRWVQAITVGSIGVLALQILAAVLGRIESGGYYQLLAAIAIVVALETLVIPILGRLHRSGEARMSKAQRLELFEEADEVFRDRTGRRYRVVEIR